MLIAFQTVHGTNLTGTDGSVGTVVDLLFGNDDWIVRHIVVDTGRWLPGKRVLLPPSLLEAFDWKRRVAGVKLSRQQVKDSPHVDTSKPVSRQMEVELFNHYDVPIYWGPVGAALAGGGSGEIPLWSQVPVEDQQEIEESLPDLRSASEVQNYYITATDGDIGHVEDFIVDDQTWAIRYMVVDTKDWLPARKVLVSPQWIESISWAESSVTVRMTREEIKGSPEWDPPTSVSRSYEEHLYNYYGQESYWLP